MMHVGQAGAGTGPEAALVATLVGGDETPAGMAFANALALPGPGFGPLLLSIRPGLPVRPHTVLVCRTPVFDERLAALILGPVQAGVAAGVLEAVSRSVIPLGGADAWRAVVNITMDTAAIDRAALFENHRVAVIAALEMGATNKPVPEDVLGARHELSVGSVVGR